MNKHQIAVSAWFAFVIVLALVASLYVHGNIVDSSRISFLCVAKAQVGNVVLSSTPYREVKYTCTSKNGWTGEDIEWSKEKK